MKILFLVLIISNLSFAEANRTNPPLNTEFRAQALDENQKPISIENPKSKRKKLTEQVAQVAPKEVSPESAGVLTLNNTFHDNYRRRWGWKTSIYFENYKTSGIGTVQQSNKFYNYSSFSETFKPILNIGFQTEKMNRLKFGANFNLGYSKQSVELSGSNIETINANFQSIDTIIEPNMSYYLTENTSVDLLAEIAATQISMISESSLARFNKLAYFYGIGFGLSSAINQNISIGFKYAYRKQLNNDLDWLINPNTVQVGASYKW